MVFFGNNMSHIANIRLGRALYGMFSGILLAIAYGTILETSHLECTQTVSSGMERECVGEYQIVDGPNIVGVVMSIIFALMFLYLAISDHKKEE